MINAVPYAVALVCLIGTALYALRAADAWHESGWYDRTIQWVGVALWVAMMAAYWDVGQRQAGILWRQWLVAGCLTTMVVLQLLRPLIRRRR